MAGANNKRVDQPGPSLRKRAEIVIADPNNELHPDITRNLSRFLQDTAELLNVNQIPEIEQQRVLNEIQYLADLVKNLRPNSRAPYAKQSEIKAEIAGIADYLFLLVNSDHVPDEHFKPLEILNPVSGVSALNIVDAVKKSRLKN